MSNPSKLQILLNKMNTLTTKCSSLYHELTDLEYELKQALAEIDGQIIYTDSGHTFNGKKIYFRGHRK